MKRILATSHPGAPRRASRRTALTVALATWLSLVLAGPAHALKSDRNQPAVINADDVELDFKDGTRTYTGNVSVQQGSMQLICDKLIASFANNKLAKATAYGSAEKLAIFKQRPDGKPYDVVGRAQEMVLDEINQMVTLIKTASLQQGTDSIAGETIIYDMAKDKMSVKGRSETQIKSKGQSEAPAQPAPTAKPARTQAEVEKTRKALPAAPARPKTAEEVVIATPPPPPAPPKPALAPVIAATAPAVAAAKTVAGTQVTTTPSGRVRIVLPPRSKRQSN